MHPDRRLSPRIRCFLQARTDRGDVVINELSRLGGMMAAPFDVELGEFLPVHVTGGGADCALHGTARRVWKTVMGCRVAWEFQKDSATQARAQRIFMQVSAPWSRLRGS